MHEEEIDLTKEAFTTMLKQCAKTGQVERAFFYMDEMRAYDAEPDIRTYVLLFRACAEVVHSLSLLFRSLLFRILTHPYPYSSVPYYSVSLLIHILTLPVSLNYSSVFLTHLYVPYSSPLVT